MSNVFGPSPAPDQRNALMQFYFSGGANNGNPAASIGGQISQVIPGLINMFDGDMGGIWPFVTLAQATVGFTNFRCIYFQNNTGVTLKDVSIWFEALNNDTSILNYMGLDPGGVNAVAQTISDETVAPVGVVFSQPTSEASALHMGNMNDGDYFAVWLEKICLSNAQPVYRDTTVLEVRGQPSTPLENTPDKGVGTTGHITCDITTAGKNIENIIKRLDSVPPLKQFIPLGNMSLGLDIDCWSLMVKKIDGITKPCLGDLDDSIATKYLGHYGLAQRYHSFNLVDVHFLILSTEVAYINPSPQYTFAKADLIAAVANPAINWIVVAQHQSMYSAGGQGDVLGFDHKVWQTTYQPLFDIYKVDIVISNHSKTYQRTYPITYNSPDNPTVVVQSGDNYTNPGGTVYLVIGTGGKDLDNDDVTTTNLTNAPAWFAQTDNQHFGYIYLTWTNGSSLLKGTFYNLSNVAIDTFSILKQI